MAAKKATKTNPEPEVGVSSPGANVQAAPLRPKTKKSAPKAPKTSALDAAHKVLRETGQPLSCAELIEAMAKKGYWASPAGKTPAATLYSALLREITTKGTQARFQKTDRGKFALKSA